MTKQLYEEALADVKKLKEVAEDNAKRALLEAVTPRIRDLIENQLLGEAAKDDKLLTDEFPVSSELDVPVDPSAEAGDEDVMAAAISTPDEEGKVTLDLDALKVAPQEYELSRESAEKLGLLMTSKENAVQQFESALRKVTSEVKLLAAAGKLVRESKGYFNHISTVISQVSDMYRHLQENMHSTPKRAEYQKILKNCHSTLKQLTEQKMKNRKATLSEAEITLKLTNVPDEMSDSLDDLGVELIAGGGDEGEEEGGDEELDLDTDEEGEEGGEGGEGEEEEEGGDEELDFDLGDEEEEKSEAKMESRRLSNNMIVEIDEGMLRREISRMKALREADETKPQSWGHGPGDVSDEFEDEDLGDPFVDVDLNEADADEADMGEAEMEELEQAIADEADMGEAETEEMEGEMAELEELEQAEDTEEYGGPHEEAQSQKQSRQPGATVESLRRRLHAEARLQAEAKQKAHQAKKMQSKKQKEAQQKQKEGQQKQRARQTREAQKKQKEAQQKARQAKQMKEAYNFYARKFNESVARSNRLRGMLAEASARKGAVLNGGSARSAAESSNLRAKLAETNLFNAKLLFTNKLLQNESLTKRQKAEVIERLDEARSEREVKLVYESLTKALQGTTSRQLSESTDRGVLGSSSRPARPASTNLNEGFEADRWARLAGIVK